MCHVDILYKVNTCLREGLVGSFLNCLPEKYAQNKWNPWSLYFKITSKLFEILVNLPNPTKCGSFPSTSQKNLRHPSGQSRKTFHPPGVFFNKRKIRSSILRLQQHQKSLQHLPPNPPDHNPTPNPGPNPKKHDPLN